MLVSWPETAEREAIGECGGEEGVSEEEAAGLAVEIGVGLAAGDGVDSVAGI